VLPLFNGDVALDLDAGAPASEQMSKQPRRLRAWVQGKQESGPMLLRLSEGRNQFARLENRKAIIRNTVHPLGGRCLT
jgi:hypothetical protein